MSQFLLALDTATSRTSVALLDGTKTVLELSGDGATSHGDVLPQLAEQVLKEISSKELNMIAVGIGPGPFTGLRVGIAFANSMAWALGINAIGVCTLDALAHDYLSRNPDHVGHFAVATDARRKEVYWARYESDGSRQGEPIVAQAIDLSLDLLNLPTAGSGAALYPQHFLNHIEPIYPTASAIGQLGLAKVERGDPISTEPLYLRRPDAVPSVTVVS